MALLTMCSGEVVDRRDIDQNIATARQGVNISWRLGGMEARYNNEMRRACKWYNYIINIIINRLIVGHKRRRIEQESAAIENMDDQDLLDLGSSSGYVSPRRIESRSQSRSRSASRSRTRSATPHLPQSSQCSVNKYGISQKNI